MTPGTFKCYPVDTHFLKHATAKTPGRESTFYDPNCSWLQVLRIFSKEETNPMQILVLIKQVEERSLGSKKLGRRSFLRERSCQRLRHTSGTSTSVQSQIKVGNKTCTGPTVKMYQTRI